MSFAPRGLAPREGLECWLMKKGRTGPLVEPRRRPQAGKSGDPRSQNADKVLVLIAKSLWNLPCMRQLSELAHEYTATGVLGPI